jgi:hypothetical protein
VREAFEVTTRMMKTEKSRTDGVTSSNDQAIPSAPRGRYQPPRIEKKRAVSRATLFSGTGPDSGGVVAAG